MTPPVERIRRLLKVAEQSHHEGEAENARALARKLQDQHGITDDQIASKPKPQYGPSLFRAPNGSWQSVHIHITYSDQDATYVKFMHGMAEVRAQLQATEDVFGWQRWYEDSTGKQPGEKEWREAYREALRRRRLQHGVTWDASAEFAGWERVENRRSHQPA